MKKSIITLFMICLFITLLFSQMKQIEIGNEFIKIIGNIEFGSFILKTTGGDPDLTEDQDVFLTSEDVEPTSLTTVSIDGQIHKFGYKIDDENGYFESRMMKRRDMITATWNANYINFSQTIKLIKGPTTGRLDTLEIKYDILNRDLRKHDVGVRIMFDTHLSPDSYEGAKKDAYVVFKLPQPNPMTITKEYQFISEQVPEYWFCFNDNEKPTIQLMGALKSSDSPMPDKIIFASWDRFKRNLFDFEIKPEREFRRFSGVQDSAVACIWKPRTLQPNESFSVKTLIGLYKEPSFKGDVFDITLSGPNKTSGEPVEIAANIKNIAPYLIKNAKAELILVDGVKLNFEEKSVKDLIEIEKNNIKRTTWSIIPDSPQSASFTLKVKVKGLLNGKSVETVVEKVIEYIKDEVAVKPEIIKNPETMTSTIGYNYYDFKPLNSLISNVNAVNSQNNSKMDEINELLELMLTKNKNVDYNIEKGKNDRSEINKRGLELTRVEQNLSKAVTSSIIKQQKTIESEASSETNVNSSSNQKNTSQFTNQNIINESSTEGQ